ncbi:YcgJ family protein [Lysobacter sp. CA196]|uniref:YcgJ family protein n=1 Tax=Lysobacter sp. CA196 TaxID=3455606 RepID=UPI003F8D112F
MKKLKCSISLLIVLIATSAQAERKNAVRTPEPGVLCDRYVCANKKGLSHALTEKHNGMRTAMNAFADKDMDMYEFTLANGIFCDVRERLCRKDRYYGPEGQRSAVSVEYTEFLFGKHDLSRL